MKKKIISILLCALLVIGIIPSGIISVTASTPFENTNISTTEILEKGITNQDVTTFEELLIALENENVSQITIIADISVPAQDHWAQLDITKNLIVAANKTLTIEAYDGPEKFGILFNDIVIKSGVSFILNTGAILTTDSFINSADEAFYNYSGRICFEPNAIFDASQGTIAENTFLNYNYGENGTNSNSIILGSNNPQNFEFSVNNEAQLRAAMGDPKCSAGIIVENDITLSNDLDVSKFLLINDFVFTVPKGNTINVLPNGMLQNSGNFLVYGTLNVYGSIFNLSIIDVIGGTLNNAGTISGCWAGSDGEITTYSSNLAIEAGASINNFIDDTMGTIEECIAIADYYYSNTNRITCSWNVLEGDKTFNAVLDNGQNNPNFDIMCVCFGHDQLKAAINAKSYWGNNNEFSANTYEYVTACGTDYSKENSVEIGDITIPSGMTLVIKESVFDGQHKYYNTYKISKGKTLNLEDGSCLVCRGKSTLTIEGSLNYTDAYINIGNFRIIGEGFVSSVTELVDAVVKGGTYILLPFIDAISIEDYSLVQVDTPLIISNDTTFTCYGGEIFYIPGLTVNKNITFNCDNFSMVLADNSTVNGNVNLQNCGITVRTPDEAELNVTTELQNNGTIIVNGGCFISGNSERWKVTNNGTIINYGYVNGDEGHYFGNSVIEYANLRDVVCDAYRRYVGCDNTVDIDYETTNEWGIEDLHWVYEYPDGGNNMFNAMNPDDSDFDALGSFSWFIKNGIIPQYDGEENCYLHPYDTINQKQASELLNKLINKIKATENISYLDITSEENIIRNQIIYLEDEGRYTSDLEELLNKVDQIIFNISYGDVNEDSQITAADALLTLQAAVGKIQLSKNKQIKADVDGIEGITASDALAILQYSVGKINSFPIEK